MLGNNGEDDRRLVLGVARSANDNAWRERLSAAEARTAMAIAQLHGLPDVLARVLAARGVQQDDARDFLTPSLKSLMPDPSRLQDMDDAVARIADALQAGRKIAIFGDYDVDGATSSAIFAKYVQWLGLEPIIHIPDRIIEGYGPNGPAIEHLHQNGAELLVTLDCGSTSFEAFETARKLGLDVVVIDHHQVGETLPEVDALVNPNRQDDLSGQGHLAAVGVTFLFLVGLNRELRRRGAFENRSQPDLMALLDLVALGTVCDVVPLQGLNRAFVTRGLAVMHQRRNYGLTALADVTRVNGKPAPYHLGFVVGPRINAGGRIGDAALGARLLTTEDPHEARAIAERLDQLNSERQAMEALMLEQAGAEAAAAIDDRDPAVLLTGSEDWHPGIVGLIASRLKDAHRRPAFAIAYDATGKGTGSGRSVPGVDLGKVVRQAVDNGLLEKGGGHAMAAGLTVQRDKAEALGIFFNETLKSDVEAATAKREIKVDAALTATGATLDLLELLEKAGPYGAGHSEPVFAFPSHRVAFADVVGKGHVRASVAAGDGTTLKAICFKAEDKPHGKMLLEGRGRNLHVTGTLSIDTWQGTPKVQLRILDVADPQKSRL
ncbi:single-stranded-DNA-specific exonuclease RecJ [Roseibium album]|uniref:Single-stranded-DNA-specific exonuclease RecJ n=1 Tax=Roseibium album TaxID=311410 RepID=A0A0M7APF0_9HYPH|nr:single-stranded-DNA-specific exonuclease RecJ [Roseibium album]CTQ62529.1 Single-stranded-DNA-specific exonuclease RecJ [Roseibium album]CTQ76120.1 Single-stranded-DNA-specific exonuclease RecJ [Roseibium album]CTQ77801.1 Single-stranded-DNA-specific exonuclease RecJ [Roseibium album]